MTTSLGLNLRQMTLLNRVYFTDRTMDAQHSYNHLECGDKKGRLYVKYTRTPKGLGWAYHCHNDTCSGLVSGFKPDISAEGVRYALKNPNTFDPKAIDDKYEREWAYYIDVVRKQLCEYRNAVAPPEANAWIKSTEIRNHVMDMFEMSWNHVKGCFHFNINLNTMIEGTKLVGYQERYFSLDKPKYITTKLTDKYPMLWCPYLGATAYVITEDILSAVKCMSAARGIALLGSGRRVSNDVLVYLSRVASHYSNRQIVFILWMDHNVAKQTLEMANWLQGRLGVPVGTIITEQDPKHIDGIELNKLIRSKVRVLQSLYGEVEDDDEDD